MLSRLLFTAAVLAVRAQCELTAEDIAKCGCTHVFPSNHYRFDGAVEGTVGGSVVCVEGGERGPARLVNLVGGENARITVKNCRGAVKTQQYHYGMALDKSQHVHLTGTGDEGVRYGFLLGGTLGVGSLSTDVEVDHVEVSGADFAGFMMKTDPTCDPATWEENFVMRNLYVHDNYIHNTGDGEGMYIGYTANEKVMDCNGVRTVGIPHRIENLRVEDNLLRDLGADGIQVSRIIGASTVKNNLIEQYGQRPFAVWQNSGMQVNGDSVEVSYNRIVNGTGNGMGIFGSGVRVIHNTLLEVGENGVFSDSRPVPTAPGEGGQGQVYLGNTFNKVGGAALKIYHRQTLSPVVVHYNTFINANEGISKLREVVTSEVGNVELTV